MISLTFTKPGHDDVYLTEDDLFEFEFERSCFSADTFELGGVQAKSVYLLIDNNAQSFSRGTFAGRRMTLEINGKYFGIYTVGNPKRRNGVIELTAYDDMVKLDCEYPSTYEFPQLFLQVYAQCLFESGIADDISKDNFVLNALFNNGIISHEYTDYIYANSCRNLVSGMAEWNGGFAYINDDNKLQVDVFSKEITREYSSDELMDFDYSDETVVFSRVRTSQKNKTYEMGDDSGYTLVLSNQYISYGLTDAMFETYLQFIYDYYSGFALTPMSFTLAEPDTELKLGDRITVYDTEENISVTGNVSKITISGNCSMTVTCGGFGSVGERNYKNTSASQLNQTGTDAKVNNDIIAARGTLTEYTVLSDTTIKYNGVTYTFTVGDSGEITGVTTDKGGAFAPTITGTLADITAHNAAFVAVAMLSGMGGIKADYIFNNRKRHESDGVVVWDNQGEDSTAVFNTFGTVSGGGVAVSGINGTAFKYPGATVDKYTWYFCARANAAITTSKDVIRNIEDCGCVMVYSDGNWELDTNRYRKGVINTGYSALDKTVITLRKSDAYLDVFINGVKVGTTTTTAGSMPSGMSFYLGGVGVKIPSMTFYGFALAKSAQSDEIIAANAQYMLDL